MKREIFRKGQYIQYFKPDDAGNPFYSIYQKKKRDTVEIVEKIKDAIWILDVGGGTGRIALDIIKRSPLKNVVLIDISADMIKINKKEIDHLVSLKAINGDAHALPIWSNSFDIIICLDLLCHLKYPHKALSEFHRVLKEKGTLVIDNTNGNPMWALFYPAYIGKNPINWAKTLMYKGVLPEWQEIVRHYKKKTFISLLLRNGFRPVKEIKYGPAICAKWQLAIAEKA